MQVLVPEMAGDEEGNHGPRDRQPEGEDGAPGAQQIAPEHHFLAQGLHEDHDHGQSDPEKMARRSRGKPVLLRFERVAQRQGQQGEEQKRQRRAPELAPPEPPAIRKRPPPGHPMGERQCNEGRDEKGQGGDQYVE